MVRLACFPCGRDVVPGHLAAAARHGNHSRVGEVVVGRLCPGRAIKHLHPVDVIGLQGVSVRDIAGHDRRPRLAVFIRMIEAQHVTKFMQGHTLNIFEGAQVSPIGVPGIVPVEDDIGFRSPVAVARRQRDRQHIGVELLSIHRPVYDYLIDSIIEGVGTCRGSAGQLHGAEHSVPTLHCSQHAARLAVTVRKRGRLR